MQQLGEGAYTLQSVFLLGIYQQWDEGCQESLPLLVFHGLRLVFYHRKQVEGHLHLFALFGVQHLVIPPFDLHHANWRFFVLIITI